MNKGKLSLMWFILGTQKHRVMFRTYSVSKFCKCSQKGVKFRRFNNQKSQGTSLAARAQGSQKRHQGGQLTADLIPQPCGFPRSPHTLDLQCYFFSPFCKFLLFITWTLSTSLYFTNEDVLWNRLKTGNGCDLFKGLMGRGVYWGENW